MKLSWGALALILVLAGCSGPSQSESAGTSSQAYKEAASSPASALAGGLDGRAQNGVAESPSEPSILKVASLTVRADKVEDAEKKAATVAQRFGGFVVGSDGNALASSSPTVSLTIKIPQARFAESITAFEGLGQRLEKSIHSDDVSNQLFDVDARIKSLQTEEASLNQLIGRAQKLADMITLRDRLSQLRTEIESLSAQQRNTRQLVAYSTLSLSLVQKPMVEIKGDDPGWLNLSLSQSTQSAGELLRSIVVVIVNIAVFSPFWLPPVLVATWWSRRGRTKQMKPPVY